MTFRSMKIDGVFPVAPSITNHRTNCNLGDPTKLSLSRMSILHFIHSHHKITKGCYEMTTFSLFVVHRCNLQIFQDCLEKCLEMQAPITKFCPECEANTKYETEFWKLPPYLLIYLNRFHSALHNCLEIKFV